MSFKIIGVILVIAGFAGFGFVVVGSSRYYTSLLRQLIRALNTMECELQYRMTPLPELCIITADVCTGKLRAVFLGLSEKLKAYTAANASQCMLETVTNLSTIPKSIERILLILGDSLGRFDLEGQLKGISFVRSTCEDLLKSSILDQNVRLHSYQTLAICAGAALAILLV